MIYIHALQVAAEAMDKSQARAGRDDNRAAETFPRFAGADARDHFVFADERADDIGAHVAELRQQDEIEQEVFALDAGKKIDFLDEVQQPRHIHQAQQRHGDGRQAVRTYFGEKQSQAQTEDEQDQETGFKIVHPGWRTVGGAEVAGDVQKRADHQQHPADDAGDFEARQPAFLR